VSTDAPGYVALARVAEKLDALGALRAKLYACRPRHLRGLKKDEFDGELPQRQHAIAALGAAETPPPALPRNGAVVS
jgi:hypothetical protein